MIDSMEKLYDYVNRYGLEGRREEGSVKISAAFSVSMNRPLLFHSGKRVESLDGWEVLAKPDVWVPLAEFDDEGTAKLIQRFEALHSFTEAAASYGRECERLRRAHAGLDSADRERYSLPDLPIVIAPSDVYVEHERVKAWHS